MSLLIVDTETTGTPASEWARVVEVGACLLDGEGTFQSYLRPDVFDERANRALAYNHITPLDVYGAPDERSVRRALYKWMAEHDVQEVWSYNRVFDERMLARSGFVLPWAGCIMRAARDMMPPRPKDPSLAEAAAYFRVAPTGTHRALADAQTAAGVLRRARATHLPT